jgi:glycosyltransferase involved in cell wall biosynthesis
LKTMMQKVLDDPAEARDKMRKAKQYILANLSCEKIVDQYERLYQSVIKQGRVG